MLSTSYRLLEIKIFNSSPVTSQRILASGLLQFDPQCRIMLSNAKNITETIPDSTLPGSSISEIDRVNCKFLVG